MDSTDGIPALPRETASLIDTIWSLADGWPYPFVNGSFETETQLHKFYYAGLYFACSMMHVLSGTESIPLVESRMGTYTLRSLF